MLGARAAQGPRDRGVAGQSRDVRGPLPKKGGALVARSRLAFPAIVLSWTSIEGLLVNVFFPATLYRMKRNTVRAKDRADAEMLRRRFGLGDE